MEEKMEEKGGGRERERERREREKEKARESGGRPGAGMQHGRNRFRRFFGTSRECHPEASVTP